MTPLVEAAHAYLNAGLSVIALTGKLPNTATHPHGLKNALVGVPECAEDDSLIERVFTHPDTTGIAIVLTHQIVVVDIDGGEGAAELAVILGLSVAEMIEWARQLDTPVAATGRGLHVYFLATRPWRTTKLGLKLDLKGEGGYVAAPPSLHPSGAVYQWGVNRRIVDDESGGRVHIDWLPDEIERWLIVHEQLLEDKRMAPTVYMQWQMIFGDDKHIIFQNLPGQADIDVLARRVAAEPPGSGNGNRLLHWAACAAAEDGHTLQEAYEAFLPVVTSEWAQPMDAKTARGTIRSAFKNTMRGK